MSAAATPLRRPGFWAFIVLMLLLTALFVGLGVWQLERLGWKEGLIAEVDARLHQPPDPLPAASLWATLDAETYQFHPLAVSGHYQGATALVFTSLSEPRGRLSGPGYWVMSAFAPDGGGIVFVNRGFVPQQQAAEFARGQGLPEGPTTLSGVAIAAEAPGPFTPAPDIANHVEWVRDPARLAALTGVRGPVFPLTIDLPAGEPGLLPQAGETVVEFPNNHLGYALTWFGFALLTPALLAYWTWRQVRPASLPPSA